MKVASLPSDSSLWRSRWLWASLVAIALLAGAVWYQQSVVSQARAMLSRECKAAAAAGDWPRVEELARQWAVHDPAAHQPWLMAAQASKAMGQYLMAADYLMQLSDPAPLEALLELSQMQMEQLNEPTLAYATCVRTKDLYPRDSENHHRLLFYYSMTCQHKQTAAEALRAIKLQCDTPVTYAYLVAAPSLTYKNGFDMNSLWLEREPDSELYYAASIMHLISNQELSELAAQESGDASKPKLPQEFFEDKLRQARQRFPTNVNLMATELGRLCQIGDVTAVANALNVAPSETVSDHRFWRFKGWYHAALEQWPEALKAYEQALLLEPLDWLSAHEMAAVMRRLEQTESATEVQRRANLGKQLLRQITLAPRIDALEDGALDNMAAYLDMCNQSETAQKLRRLIKK